MSRFLFVLLLVSSTAFAQTVKTPRKHAPAVDAPAGRTLLATPKPATPTDSVAFDTQFHALWTVLKPKTSIRQRIDQRFKRTLRMMQARGVDSAIAYDSLIAAMDTSIDRQMFKSTLIAEGFSAADLKALLAFLASPTGKKFATSEAKLMEARDQDVDRYIQRLFSSVITPMMKTRALPRPRPSVSPLDTVGRARIPVSHDSLGRP